jgi:hypothetical protein
VRMPFRLTLSAIAVALTALLPPAFAPQTAPVALAADPTSFSCSPVLFTVAGSNERDASPVMNKIAAQWRSKPQFAGKTLAVVPINYPAQPWTRYIDLAAVLRAVVINGTETALHFPPTQSPINWDGLTKSEDMGVARLKEAVASTRSVCPNRFVAIAGYSQGADVVSRYVSDPSTSNKNRIAVALYGNPSENQATVGIRTFLGVASYQTPPTIAYKYDKCLPADPLCDVQPRNLVTQIRKIFDGTSPHYGYDDDKVIMRDSIDKLYLIAVGQNPDA